LSDRTGELVIIAGNQRYDACVQLGIKEVPTVLIPNLTEEREREIIIRDNVNNGEWDMARLFEWDCKELMEWGLKLLKPENCVDRLFKFLSLTNEGHCVRNIMKLSDMNLLFLFLTTEDGIWIRKYYRFLKNCDYGCT
jgi:hypothetical protein